eukprot:2937435-Pleurochrysis_carterae.AAC.3
MVLLACFAQFLCRRRFVNDASAWAVSTAICVLFDVLTNLPVVITEPDPLKRPADDHVPEFRGGSAGGSVNGAAAWRS